MHPVTLTVSASFYYTSGNRKKALFFFFPTSSLATDDKQRWMKRLQWSLPHRGRQAARGAQADFSSCSFYLTYFLNHKVTFEVQQDAYRKHSPKKNLKARDYKDPWFPLQVLSPLRNTPDKGMYFLSRKLTNLWSILKEAYLVAHFSTEGCSGEGTAGEKKKRRLRRPASELCILSKTVKSFILTTGKQHERGRESLSHRERTVSSLCSASMESLWPLFSLSGRLRTDDTLHPHTADPELMKFNIRVSFEIVSLPAV